MACSADVLTKYPAGTLENYKRYPNVQFANECWYGYDGVNTVVWAQDPAVLYKGQVDDKMSTTQMIGWGVLGLALVYGIWSASKSR
jgi:hypothetical protein